MARENEVSTVEIRERLSDLINRVAFGKSRLTLTRRNKAIAALVPMEDLELLEKLEDRVDLLLALRELEDQETKGAETRSWDQVKKAAGLTESN